MDIYEILPVVDNRHMEGTVSQIFDKAPSFYFMIKNGKLFVIVFFIFTLHLKKMRTKSYIKILRRCSLHIYSKNNQ